MPTKGYDLFITEPNTQDEQVCRVCGSKCNLTRNKLGPTGFIDGMTGTSRYHDAFVCPYTKEEWHEQALELVEAIDDTPSKKVAELMRQDLEDLLVQHGVKKK